MLTPSPQKAKWLSQAPASSMILGEHSVVYGYPALVCAVDQFIYIHWQFRTDNEIHIDSTLANHKTLLEEMQSHPQLTFVCEALACFQKTLPAGLTIQINSEFLPSIGLGSSAAVLAAMLSGLNQICQTQLSGTQLFELGHRIIIKLQGHGSGADLAACLTGGIVYFEPKTAEIPQTKLTKLNQTLPFILIYAGYKTPTSEVLTWVAKYWRNKPEALGNLYQQMGEITKQTFKALQKKDFIHFFQGCCNYQQKMDDLGVGDKTLTLLIKNLRQCPQIGAAKISGSGLGDCVIGLLRPNKQFKNCHPSILQKLSDYQQMYVEITELGAFTKQIV